MLCSYATRPGEPRRAAAEALIGNQFNDLRAAQAYLTKQAGWLDVVFMSPGPLMDCESGEDPAVLEEVRLVAERIPNQGPISYTRLASGMLLAAGEEKWLGRYVMPLATSKVGWKFRDVDSPIETGRAYARYVVLPVVIRGLALVTLGTVFGYVLGVREGGRWPLRRFGWDLKA